jgi:hypothetical protein
VGQPIRLSCLLGLRRDGRQRVAERGAGRDPELGIELVEMGRNRPVREKETLSDLLVGQSLSGELGDLQLLQGQRYGDIRRRPARTGAGRPQLARRLLRPWSGAEHTEAVEGSSQLDPSLARGPRAPEVFAVRRGGFERARKAIG